MFNDSILTGKEKKLDVLYNSIVMTKNLVKSWRESSVNTAVDWQNQKMPIKTLDEGI